MLGSKSIDVSKRGGGRSYLLLLPPWQPTVFQSNDTNCWKMYTMPHAKYTEMLCRGKHRQNRYEPPEEDLTCSAHMFCCCDGFICITNRCNKYPESNKYTQWCKIYSMWKHTSLWKYLLYRWDFRMTIVVFQTVVFSDRILAGAFIIRNITYQL